MTDGKPFWYLGTPYSLYGPGPYAAYVLACKITARLLKAGVAVYSPIAHSHPVASYGNLDKFDHDLWLAADRPFMDAACGLLVAKMAGWRESRGLAEELRVFGAQGKPIIFLDEEYWS